MLEPILNEQGLAELLKVPATTVAALLADINFPRFYVRGQARFLLTRVLAWLEAREGQDILPEEAPAAPEPPPPPPNREPSELPAAGPGEHAWLTGEGLDALFTGASDPGRNLDRLKVRDALLELNDALLGALARFSDGRLHPHYDEKSRTSPWRIDLGSERRIDAISIAWGAGEHAPPQFDDRPHLEVEVSKGELRVALDAVRRTFSPAVVEAEIERLGEAGIAVEMAADGVTPCAFAKVYSLPEPAPTLDSVVEALIHDLELLVPLWARLTS